MRMLIVVMGLIFMLVVFTAFAKAALVNTSLIKSVLIR